MTLTPLNARATLWSGFGKVNRQNAGFFIFSAFANLFIAYMGYKIEINEKKIGGWRIFIYQLRGIKVERAERDCQTVKIPDHARVERSSTTLGMINALPTQSGWRAAHAVKPPSVGR